MFYKAQQCQEPWSRRVHTHAHTHTCCTCIIDATSLHIYTGYSTVGLFWLTTRAYSGCFVCIGNILQASFMEEGWKGGGRVGVWGGGMGRGRPNTAFGP